MPVNNYVCLLLTQVLLHLINNTPSVSMCITGKGGREEKVLACECIQYVYQLEMKRSSDGIKSENV
jgi:hypothetical protein